MLGRLRGIDDVLNVPSNGTKHIGNQRAVASPPHFFGAHNRGGRSLRDHYELEQSPANSLVAMWSAYPRKEVDDRSG